MNRKAILYIAASLDGYIAKPGDNLDFLQLVEMPREDYGYSQFNKQIDTIILGKRTYDWVMEQVGEFPHQGKETYVLTRQKRDPIGTVTFFSGDLAELISTLKSKSGKRIFVDGGAQTVHRFLKDGLLDEIIISFIPILLGEGIRLFKEGFPEQNLTLIESKNYPSGLIQVHYQIKK
ncbi:dihydrofolate reductase family protein [Algoriphagus persicinus]|uniref:dihydrofolate reductase family protein n=1 Tax=Algoriphagus persicinus TaxID=3108754 RepID=UPI002B3DF23E|nr:dihydrofolate reductase family protein [Algoriphagus sp. E1-3-M2]MEB2787345.1 dihydrofolate reductase family protein [Algoriphagus sp. E1-3-M2]